MSDKYSDIIKFSRPVSKRPRMAIIDRAAQFSAFAALTGHSDAVKETARLTDARTELDENEIEILDEKLRLIDENKDAVVSITYFIPDEKKNGGSYRTVMGTVKKIDAYSRAVTMSDKTVIDIEAIREITGDIFPFY